jgi:hypothetical protein
LLRRLVGLQYFTNFNIRGDEMTLKKSIAATDQVVGERRELSIREARRMGLTFGELRGIYRDLLASGEIDDESSAAEKSVAVAREAEARNPEAFKGIADWDWDKIFAFIEKLIALFSKFFV